MATRPLPVYRFSPAPAPHGGRSGEARTMAPRAILDGLDGMKRDARGEVIPEPVVGRGVISGRPYTFGERGPEGVVPTNMLPDFLRRRGGSGSYALGGEIGYDAEPYSDVYADTGTPYGGDVYADTSSGATTDTPYADPNPPITQLPDTSTAPGAPTYDQWLASGSPSLIPEAPAPSYTAPQLPSTNTAPIETTTPNTVIPPPQPFALTPPQQADMQRQIAETAARNKTGTTPPVIPPTPPVVPPATQPIQQPTQLPQGPATAQPVAAQPTALANPFTGQPATTRVISSAGTFGRSIPGATPRFLAGEDTGGGESTLQALLSSGLLPPFLSRIFGQREGVPSVGTNQPQPYQLPSDVPLISRLAYEQMAPSERAAFESFISSYGVEPSDYWAYVQQAGPQGGIAPFSPLFGTRFQPYRQ